jgi:membrane dipeptidase
MTKASIFDGHNDLPWKIRCQTNGNLEIADPGTSLRGRTHTDLERLRIGGVGAQFWSVYAPSTLSEREALLTTLEQIDLVHRMILRHPDCLSPATNADDCRRAIADGRIASLLGAEGGHCIASSLPVLRMLHRLGVRYLTLTHNHSTAWADSATDAPRANGLSEFGREVVTEMNKIGMIVDLSHVAASTMHAALNVTAKPVVFSHSSARSLVDNPRNVPDDVLARLPANGGVCQVTFVPAFVSTSRHQWLNDLSAAMDAHGLDSKDLDERTRFSTEFATEHPRPRATIADVADHIEHVREVAGVDHVGLGGDFDGTDDLPAGLDDVACYPNLMAELRSRGWSTVELDKLAWENVLRVVADVCSDESCNAFRHSSLPKKPVV